MSDTPGNIPETEMSIVTGVENVGVEPVAELAANAAMATPETDATMPQALPFNADPIALDPASVRDGLTDVQSRGSAATRISGEHLAGLLYDQGKIGTHRAPYGIRYAPNFADGTREEPTEG